MRQLVDPTSRDGAIEVLTAARLLNRIEDLLTDFDRRGMKVDLYRRQIPDWVAAMVSYQAGWGQQLSSDQVISAEHLDEIEGLANFLDGKVYILGAGTETLDGLLARAHSLLADDDELDQQLTEYIHRLLQQITIALEDDAVGIAFDYADAVQRLWVAFRAAEGASPEYADRWRDLWTQISAGTVSGALVQVGSIVIQAITAGPN